MRITTFVAALMVWGGTAIDAASAQSLVQTATVAESDTKLVYFGAKDCSACRKFVWRDLRKVRTVAQGGGFAFERHEVRSQRDVFTPGAYGSSDALAKAALDKSDILALPLFAVVQDGKLVAAKAGDWESMVRVAAGLAR